MGHAVTHVAGSWLEAYITQVSGTHRQWRCEMTGPKLPGFAAEASLAKSGRYYAAAWTSANRMSSGEIMPQFGNCRRVPHSNGCVYECCNYKGCEYIDVC
jgi:hypothetical protein